MAATPQSATHNTQPRRRVFQPVAPVGFVRRIVIARSAAQDVYQIQPHPRRAVVKCANGTAVMHAVQYPVSAAVRAAPTKHPWPRVWCRVTGRPDLHLLRPLPLLGHFELQRNPAGVSAPSATTPPADPALLEDAVEELLVHQIVHLQTPLVFDVQCPRRWTGKTIAQIRKDISTLRDAGALSNNLTAMQVVLNAVRNINLLCATHLQETLVPRPYHVELPAAITRTVVQVRVVRNSTSDPSVSQSDSDARVRALAVGAGRRVHTPQLPDALRTFRLTGAVTRQSVLQPTDVVATAAPALAPASAPAPAPASALASASASASAPAPASASASAPAPAPAPAPASASATPLQPASQTETTEWPTARSLAHSAFDAQGGDNATDVEVVTVPSPGDLLLPSITNGAVADGGGWRWGRSPQSRPSQHISAEQSSPPPPPRGASAPAHITPYSPVLVTAPQGQPPAAQAVRNTDGPVGPKTPSFCAQLLTKMRTPARAVSTGATSPMSAALPAPTHVTVTSNPLHAAGRAAALSTSRDVDAAAKTAAPPSPLPLAPRSLPLPPPASAQLVYQPALDAKVRVPPATAAEQLRTGARPFPPPNETVFQSNGVFRGDGPSITAKRLFATAPDTASARPGTAGTASVSNAARTAVPSFAAAVLRSRTTAPTTGASSVSSTTDRTNGVGSAVQQPAAASVGGSSSRRNSFQPIPANTAAVALAVVTTSTAAGTTDTPPTHTGDATTDSVASSATGNDAARKLVTAMIAADKLLPRVPAPPTASSATDSALLTAYYASSAPRVGPPSSTAQLAAGSVVSDAESQSLLLASRQQRRRVPQSSTSADGSSLASTASVAYLSTAAPVAEHAQGDEPQAPARARAQSTTDLRSLEQPAVQRHLQPGTQSVQNAPTEATDAQPHSVQHVAMVAGSPGSAGAGSAYETSRRAGYESTSPETLSLKADPIHRMRYSKNQAIVGPAPAPRVVPPKPTHTPPRPAAWVRASDSFRDVQEGMVGRPPADAPATPKRVRLAAPPTPSVAVRAAPLSGAAHSLLADVVHAQQPAGSVTLASKGMLVAAPALVRRAGGGGGSPGKRKRAASNTHRPPALSEDEQSDAEDTGDDGDGKDDGGSAHGGAGVGMRDAPVRADKKDAEAEADALFNFLTSGDAGDPDNASLPESVVSLDFDERMLAAGGLNNDLVYSPVFDDDMGAPVPPTVPIGAPQSFEPLAAAAAPPRLGDSVPYQVPLVAATPDDAAGAAVIVPPSHMDGAAAGAAAASAAADDSGLPPGVLMHPSVHVHVDAAGIPRARRVDAHQQLHIVGYRAWAANGGAVVCNWDGICDAVFANEGEWAKHALAVHMWPGVQVFRHKPAGYTGNVRGWICPVPGCMTEYYQSALDLVAHAHAQHLVQAGVFHGQQPFACFACASGFNSVQNLREHYYRRPNRVAHRAAGGGKHSVTLCHVCRQPQHTHAADGTDCPFMLHNGVYVTGAIPGAMFHGNMSGLEAQRGTYVDASGEVWDVGAPIPAPGAPPVAAGAAAGSVNVLGADANDDMLSRLLNNCEASLQAQSEPSGNGGGGAAVPPPLPDYRINPQMAMARTLRLRVLAQGACVTVLPTVQAAENDVHVHDQALAQRRGVSHNDSKSTDSDEDDGDDSGGGTGRAHDQQHASAYAEDFSTVWCVCVPLQHLESGQLVYQCGWMGCGAMFWSQLDWSQHVNQVHWAGALTDSSQCLVCRTAIDGGVHARVCHMFERHGWMWGDLPMVRPMGTDLAAHAAAALWRRLQQHAFRVCYACGAVFPQLKMLHLHLKRVVEQPNRTQRSGIPRALQDECLCHVCRQRADADHVASVPTVCAPPVQAQRKVYGNCVFIDRPVDIEPRKAVKGRTAANDPQPAFVKSLPPHGTPVSMLMQASAADLAARPAYQPVPLQVPGFISL